jgi:hypothetical protein
MKTSFYWLTLGSLAAWRLTHALHAEDGPGDVFAIARERLRTVRLFRFVDCFYCLSLWVSLPIALRLGAALGEKGFLWFAISGAACLFERLGAGPAGPAIYWEKKEDQP